MVNLSCWLGNSHYQLIFVSKYKYLLLSQELLGIAYNRLILMDINTQEQKKTWRYSAMKSWNVNWESKQLRVDHEEEKLLFQCLSADLKIVHEFIGGNIWLSLRNDKDPLDLSMFVKLTGGVTNNLSGWGSETMARFLASWMGVVLQVIKFRPWILAFIFFPLSAL